MTGENEKENPLSWEEPDAVKLGYEVASNSKRWSICSEFETFPILFAAKMV